MEGSVQNTYINPGPFSLSICHLWPWTLYWIHASDITLFCRFFVL